jgi:hypothetical protein
MNVSLAVRFALFAQLGFAANAWAVPPDQPPLGLPVATPNFDYFVRSGAQAPHVVTESRLKQFARALDRSGTAQNGNPLGYHAGFLARGFSAPYFSDANADVVFWACADNPGGYDCDNGRAPLDQIVMPTDVYGQAGESCVRGILGHELFHHIEFGYTQTGGGSGCGGVFGNTACEGQARALQDKFYWDLDLNPAASCVATYRGEVNGYLGAPDVTIWNASYGAALFWTYLMEQYGEFPFEPGRGVDFLVDWWDIAQTSVAAPNIYQVTDEAIKLDHPTHSVLAAYHDFTIANVVKDLDLSSESDAFRLRYSYRDEEPVPLMTNLMQFQPVAMPADLVVVDGGSANSSVTANRFGAEYRRFDVSACPAGRLMEFTATPSPQGVSLGGGTQQAIGFDGMFALIPVRGGVEGQPAGLYKQRAKSWKQMIPQPAAPYSHVIAVTAGWHTQFQGTLALRCKPTPPPASIALISAARPAISGAPGSIGEITVQVDDPEAPFAPIDTLAQPAFGVQIGLLLPAVQKVREAAARHRLIFPFPDLPLGTADATVSVGAQQTTFADGVRVAPHRPEFMIAIDTTASMGLPAGASKLATARAMVRYLLLALPADARVGLITYAGDSAVPANNTQLRAPLAPLDATQRSTLETQLAAVVPSTALEVTLSDLLVSSIAQFDNNGNDGERHLLLLTDSGDGEADVSTLAAQARAAGVRVHSIALDTSADQPLHAQFSGETGGTFAFADAGHEPPSPLLLPAVQAAREAARRSQCSATAQGTAAVGAPAVLTLGVDEEVDAPAGGGPHVKVFSGASGTAFAAVRLYRPDGSLVVAGPDVDIFTTSTAFAFHVRDGDAGNWRLEVDAPSAGGPPLPVFAQAEVVDPARSLRLAFATPAGTPAPLDHFRVGDPVLVQLALVDFVGETEPGTATALVKTGTGTLVLSLNDEGQHGDESAGDRVYSAIYRQTASGSATGFDDSGAAPGTLGTYTVEAAIDLGSAAAPNVLRTTRQFTVVQDAVVADSDADTLPDRFETTHACLAVGSADASADRDGDGASNAAEYANGSDPCDVDSDDGGETDGSEIARNAQPLDASDDGVRRIHHIEIVTSRSDHEEDPALPALAHTLRYDADLGFAQLVVKRATSPQGPFADHAVLTGAAIDGTHVDAALSNGQQYCYQLAGHSAAGRVGAASDIVCGTARNDNTAPLGSIILNDGAPRTVGGSLSAKLSIDGEPATGMQMNLRYPDGVESGWVPYMPFALIDANAQTAPSTITVGVLFRDAAGNQSTLYVDDIDRVSAGSVGRIIGRVREAAAGGAGPAIGGVTISPSLDSEATAASESDGDFSLDALPPGNYTLVIEHPGYAPLTVPDVTVAAGGVVDLGDLLLQGFAMFRDGFEAQ